MITARLVGDEQVIARLSRIHPALMERLKVSVTRLAMELVAHVVRDKLSGQVLGKYLHGKATNRLRNSINPGSLIASDTGVSRRVGTNVEYAAIHEYGGTINHPGGTAYFPTKTGEIRFVSNANALPHMPRTRPHPIQMPERSFLRSALKDMQEEIFKTFAQDVAAVVKK